MNILDFPNLASTINNYYQKSCRRTTRLLTCTQAAFAALAGAGPQDPRSHGRNLMALPQSRPSWDMAPSDARAPVISGEQVKGSPREIWVPPSLVSQARGADPYPVSPW